LKDLQKELNELHNHQKEERYGLWRECAQVHKDYEDFKMSKHNIWVECEEHKKSVSFLNNELLKNQEFKGQPQDVVKLHEEIRTLKITLSKIFNETNTLNKLLGYYRSSLANLEIAMMGRYMFMLKAPLYAIFVEKMDTTSRCRDRPKKGLPNPFMTNTKGPKKVWVPMKWIFLIPDVLDYKKQTPIMVPGRWLLTTHDRRKVYVLIPDSLSWWNNHFQRESKRQNSWGR